MKGKSQMRPVRVAVAVVTMLVASVGAFAGLGLAAGPAQASDLSYVWDDYSTCAPLYGVPSTEPGVVVQECAENDTKFAMDCWQDNDGERWFYGQVYDTGSWLYVQARWVGDQVDVGAC